MRERLAPNLRAITEIVTAADFIAHETAKEHADEANVIGAAEPETNEMLERNGYTGARLQALCDRTLKALERSKMFISLVEGPALQKAGFDKIMFGWAGVAEVGGPHYYRVQGPTFLIEYDNTQNNSNHIHSVWRDYNGDFGTDLLKAHYQDFHQTQSGRNAE